MKSEKKFKQKPFLPVPVNEETVNSLRYRLNAMKDIMGDDNDPKALAARKKAAKRRTAG